MTGVCVALDAFILGRSAPRPRGLASRPKAMTRQVHGQVIGVGHGLVGDEPGLRVYRASGRETTYRLRSQADADAALTAAQAAQPAPQPAPQPEVKPDAAVENPAKKQRVEQAGELAGAGWRWQEYQRKLHASHLYIYIYIYII